MAGRSRRPLISEWKSPLGSPPSDKLPVLPVLPSPRRRVRKRVAGNGTIALKNVEDALETTEVKQVEGSMMDDNIMRSPLHKRTKALTSLQSLGQRHRNEIIPDCSTHTESTRMASNRSSAPPSPPPIAAAAAAAAAAAEDETNNNSSREGRPPLEQRRSSLTSKRSSTPPKRHVSFSEENPLDSTADSKDFSPIPPRRSVVNIKCQPSTKQQKRSSTEKSPKPTEKRQVAASTTPNDANTTASEEPQHRKATTSKRRSGSPHPVKRRRQAAAQATTEEEDAALSPRSTAEQQRRALSPRSTAEQQRRVSTRVTSISEQPRRTSTATARPSRSPGKSRRRESKPAIVVPRQQSRRRSQERTSKSPSQRRGLRSATTTTATTTVVPDPPVVSPRMSPRKSSQTNSTKSPRERRTRNRSPGTSGRRKSIEELIRIYRTSLNESDPPPRSQRSSATTSKTRTSTRPTSRRSSSIEAPPNTTQSNPFKTKTRTQASSNIEAPPSPGSVSKSGRRASLEPVDESPATRRKKAAAIYDLFQLLNPPPLTVDHETPLDQTLTSPRQSSSKRQASSRRPSETTNTKTKPSRGKGSASSRPTNGVTSRATRRKKGEAPTAAHLSDVGSNHQPTVTFHPASKESPPTERPLLPYRTKEATRKSELRSSLSRRSSIPESQKEEPQSQKKKSSDWRTPDDQPSKSLSAATLQKKSPNSIMDFPLPLTGESDLSLAEETDPIEPRMTDKRVGSDLKDTLPTNKRASLSRSEHGSGYLSPFCRSELRRLGVISEDGHTKSEHNGTNNANNENDGLPSLLSRTELLRIGVMEGPRKKTTTTTKSTTVATKSKPAAPPKASSRLKTHLHQSQTSSLNSSQVLSAPRKTSSRLHMHLIPRVKQHRRSPVKQHL